MDDLVTLPEPLLAEPYEHPGVSGDELVSDIGVRSSEVVALFVFRL